MTEQQTESHRETYPEQYTHPLCGKRVRVKASVALQRDAGEWTVERVVTSRFGELVLRDQYNAYHVDDVEIVEPEKRWCYYIDAGQRDENGYIPSVVTEGEAGHSPLTGRGEGAMPWYWGDTYEQAKATCAMMNADMGITQEDADKIVASSMFATETPEPAAGTDYECAECGGHDVQVSLPAWFDPNKDLAYVEVDAEAHALSTYCNDCGDTHPLKYREGEITGRWGA